MTPPDPVGGAPNFDEMTPEQMIAWLESLAKRQGVREEELTTSADMVIAEPPPDAVIDEPGYVPYSAMGGMKPSAAASKPEPEPLPQPAPSIEEEIPLAPTVEEPEAPVTVSAETETTIAGLEGIDEAIMADPMAWLESLAKRQGAREEELITAADLEIAEPLPDAIIDEPGYTPFDPGGRIAALEAEPVPPHAPREPEPVAEAALPVEPEAPELPPTVMEGFEGLDEQIMADPMAWLESLARRQGVSEEELVTAANLDIASPPPDTVIEEPGYVPYDAFAESRRPSAREVEEAPAPPPPAAPEPIAVEPVVELELPPAELVEEPEVPELPEEMPAADLFGEEEQEIELEPTVLPAWLRAARPAAPPAVPELPEIEAFGAPEVEEPVSLEWVPSLEGEALEDDSLAWLESLASEQGAELADFLSATTPAPPVVPELEDEGEREAPTLSRAMSAFTEDTTPAPAFTEEVVDPLAGLSDAEIEELMARGQLTREQQQAWLERQTDSLLAAREGGELAFEEEAGELPPPLPAEIPEWLADQMPASLTMSAEPAPLSEEIVPPPVPGDLPDWLSSLTEVEEAFSVEEAEVGATPSFAEIDEPSAAWLETLTEAVEAEEPLFDVTEAEAAGSEPLPEEETLRAGEPGPLPAWLQTVTEEAPLATADESLGWLSEEMEVEAAPSLDTSLDWLAAETPAEGVAPAASEDIAAWLRQQEEAPLAAAEAGEAMPAWLGEVEEEVAEEVAAEAAAAEAAVVEEAMAEEEVIEAAVAEAAVVEEAMAEAVEAITPAEEVALPEIEPVVEAAAPAIAEVLPTPAPVPAAAAPPAPAPTPVVTVPAAPARATAPLEPASPETAEAWFARARQLKTEGEFAESLVDYERLIRAEQHLDSIAGDLEEIARQLATNIEVRRLLGDVYLRQNRLQEALDTYRGALDQL